MPGHLIRLRGGWEWQLPPGGLGMVRRVTLPTRWTTGLSGPIRLVRRFGRPPSDPRIEFIELEIRDVPGLKSARLNGIELAENAPGSWAQSVLIEQDLTERNELVLEVDLDLIEESRMTEPWGSVALMIRPKPDTLESRGG